MPQRSAGIAEPVVGAPLDLFRPGRGEGSPRSGVSTHKLVASALAAALSLAITVADAISGSCLPPGASAQSIGYPLRGSKMCDSFTPPISYPRS